jgi:hypothetical protein
MKAQSVDRILQSNHGPCNELFDTSHFHIDVYGNYIPGLCTGLSLDHEDLGKPVDPERYPFLYALMTGGIGALLAIAEEQYGFRHENDSSTASEVNDSYVSKCGLCYRIRRFLVVDRNVESPDLQPKQYYTVE